MTTIWDIDPDPSRISELTAEECWHLLADARFGRLAYRLADEVNIVPINIGVDGHRLVFRTAEGSKLLGIHMSEKVAFEIDDVGIETATSVVARGTTRVLSGDDEARAETVLPSPWTEGWKGTVVGIEVAEVTGRRFQLRRR
ncbi:pyridoxamine 5'-phosphate oxidase family protein [Ruania alkalisoli]|uniref:Pyridoxamine 5'-phosphate oxidase family protein n=1 Tax=Ruania alkalisoli TaxID=2779775 RepID=A0A7M1SSW5_9MICO|nr:pyridoxamine 5'-phosphate oxidase family protein [Ruania alkalisoli]QOR70585.1 pyridoxamine 5'-phosphate oxidase family protein [Ruania alkalisoli]